MAFYQKYRAKKFSEIIGQSHVTATLLESVKNGKFVHAYLLTGPRGIGKTSIARLLAKAINCQTTLEDKKNGKPITGEPCNKCDTCKEINENKALDIIEIDAASHTGVDDIRELIEKSRLHPTKLSKKVYIIDEVHMLSKNAFNALLKTLEEPPSHVVFILATTEVHKIPATVLSRAQRFDLKRAQKEEIIENLKRVAQAENIDIDEESLDLIAVSAFGGHRDALGLLEQVGSANKKITIDLTRQILGIAETEEVFKFIEAIFNDQPEEGLKIARELFDRGTDLAEFNRSIIAKLRQILLFQFAGQAFDDETKEGMEKIRDLSKKEGAAQLLSIIEIFINAGNLLKDVSYPLLPIEMAVIKSRELFSLHKESTAVNQEQIAKRNHSQLDQTQTKTSSPKLSEVETNSDRAIEIPDKMPFTKPTKEEKSNTVPVPVLEMTRDIWEKIIEQTKKENSTLAALLRDAIPEEFTNDSLVLGVKFKFHKDRISETKHTQMLEKIVKDVSGLKCRVDCKITDGRSKIKKPTEKQNLETAAAEVFEIES